MATPLRCSSIVILPYRAAINSSSSNKSLRQGVRSLTTTSSSTLSRFSPCPASSHHGRSFESQPLTHAPPPPSRELQRRYLSSRASLLYPPRPKNTDRGPPSEEDTQTHFPTLDIFATAGAPQPTTGIDACMPTGFALDNNSKVSGAGIFLLDGEIFTWAPWNTHRSSTAGSKRITTQRGTFEPPLLQAAFSLLELVWPKPDLLILGTGRYLLPPSPKVREALNALGIRLEVADTRNAAAQFNLLATERGTREVAAALIPIGWVEGRGLVDR